jgi:hypothetical protein
MDGHHVRRSTVKKHSPRPASGSAKPCPTLEETRRAIINHLTADAIDAYETARRRFATYTAAMEDDLTPFGILVDRRLREAREYLVRVLLTRSEAHADDDGPEDCIRATTGVIVGDRVYLASVSHEYVHGPCEVGDSPPNRGEPLMGLTVAARADVAEMDLVDLDAEG